MPTIPATDLDVFPLCLGGNVFGWTADAPQSAVVLDAYAAAGGNFVDTADVYSSWAPGNSGGESERIIGDWMAARGNRDAMVVATKVGYTAGLSAATIHTSAEASLRRLRTDRIDLYYAHVDDPDTPLEETLGALDALVREGKVRYVAASQFSPERLAASLAIQDRDGLARYVALQPLYNLVQRDEYEGPLAEVAVREQLGVCPFYGIAKGFLTGKYRPGSAVASQHAQQAGALLDERGIAVLEALDAVADAHATTVAAVALAWLRSRPGIVAPLASARTPEQLAELLPMADLQLTENELSRLTAASG